MQCRNQVQEENQFSHKIFLFPASKTIETVAFQSFLNNVIFACLKREVWAQFAVNSEYSYLSLVFYSGANVELESKENPKNH
jgi:hypothetical protein